MHRVFPCICRSYRNICLSRVAYDVKVKMPSLSPTMESGTIVKWLKKEGETVKPGDVICEIQTDKAVVGLEIEDEGTLAKIVLPDGSADVNVGTLIAILAESGEDWKNVSASNVKESKQPDKESKKAAADTKKPAQKPLASTKQTKDHHVDFDKPLGPSVRLLLQLYDIRPTDVKSSGPHGVLLKGDVLQFITAKKLQPKPQKGSKIPEITKSEGKQKAEVAVSKPRSGGYSDVQLSNMRKTIAKRLTEAKTKIPHAYASVSFNINRVLSLRKQLKEDKIAVSVNDIIVKACAVALQMVPEVNVQYVSDGAVRKQSSVDISVAVATSEGLITPIVFGADKLGLIQISEKIRELAEKAKAKKLQLNEFQGGTFTISNLGMFGIDNFTAIINPPQAAILAVGASQPSVNHKGESVARLTVTLCFDNRAISDTDAGRFLAAFRTVMEEPSLASLGQTSESFGADREELVL